jgi:transposase-like protein
MDVQRLFAERSKQAMAKLGLELLELEVQELCSERYSRKGDALCYRGGSAPTSFLVDGARLDGKRPRVRNAAGHEVPLATLEKLQDRDLCDEQMRNRMMAGLTSRNYDEVVDTFSKKTGISKSSVSKAFVRVSKRDLDEINHGDLSAYRFVALLLDGTIVEGRTVVVAVGITTDSQKIPVGIVEGDSENAEVVKALLSSMRERKFTFASSRLLALLDGSKALKCALRALWGDAIVIQRCFIHKARNLCEWMPKRAHSEIYSRLKKIMGLTTYSAAKHEFELLAQWLGSVSYDAERSLREVGDDMLTLHRLGVTGELRKSLSTTNIIENLMGRIKDKTNRVKNWKLHPKTKKQTAQDRLLRWVASSIQRQRKKMKRVRGGKIQMDALVASLNVQLELKKIPA